ncbi:MAG: hypothetical protein HOE48_07025 [Candidatus Latescibacteria bacterium]|nr:hypothetical protein [Candidatus Latescibacterota bacterium]MBT4137649.1 hypothetical protein [Candidatus Latescibacterota bacterium]MBT5829705.1 hypothetical protein [Candidatus Latescibacterota bacterium]
MNNPLILRAHIAELEELRDKLLAQAKDGQVGAREMVSKLHREAMEKRDRLRESPGPIL